MARPPPARVPLMVGLNFRYLAVTQATEGALRRGPPRPARLRPLPLRTLARRAAAAHQPLPAHHAPPDAVGAVDPPLRPDALRLRRPSRCAISARTWNPPWSMYADDANVAALITFANGVEVTYQGTWAAQPQLARLRLAHRLRARHRRAGRHVRRALLRAAATTRRPRRSRCRRTSHGFPTRRASSGPSSRISSTAPRSNARAPITSKRSAWWRRFRPPRPRARP